MTTRKAIRKHVAVALAIFGAACASTQGQESAGMSTDSGAGLWSRTCSHCHNLRTAPEFTPDQWSVIVTHMRTHGDLTRSEAEEIAAYLRSVRER
jgi:cytochrome c2